MFKRISIVILTVVLNIVLFPLDSFAVNFDTEKIYTSVVVVYSGDSVGSGFAIDTNRIVTNAHVVDSSSVTIKTYAGDIYRAYVAYVDGDVDVAILEVTNVTFVPLQPADIARVKVGDDVYAIGTPNGMSYTLTKGIISAKDRYVSGFNYLQTDAAINTGNSGGPLLNQVGEVIGVNTLKINGSEGISLALPITTVYEYMDRMNNTSDTVNLYDVPTTNTEIINNVLPDNQHKSMLQLGFVIVLISSILLNITLFVRNRSLRNRLVLLRDDRSNRTDFDIEIQG
jgi:serine protease Do